MKRYLIILFTTFLLFNCKEESTLRLVELPETSVVSSNSSWGVVKYPYIRVRKSADMKDFISSAFRQGDIVKIIKSSQVTTSTNGQDIYWFYTVLDDVEGWVTGDNLSIFESREQAVTASKMLR